VKVGAFGVSVALERVGGSQLVGVGASVPPGSGVADGSTVAAIDGVVVGEASWS